MKLNFTIILVLGFFIIGNSQITDSIEQHRLDSIQKVNKAIEYKKNHTDYYVLRKGRFFASWGYNRSTYGHSDIRLWGNGYDFTIRNAVAKDRPTKFDPKVYFNPTTLSIPQYNFRIGYFFTNKLSLSFSVDHMKYVFQKNQVATVDGFIDSSASTEWADNYDNEVMKVPEELLKYEHTDGLNILSLELDYNDLFYESYNRKFAVDLIAGVGLGATVPKTNALLFNTLGNDAFHWAGIGVTANVGIKLFFFKHFFIHPTTKVGFLYMPNIATNEFEVDRAAQNISFFQLNFTLGYQIKIAHK